MSKEKDFEEDLEKAVKWVAAEHKYFQQLAHNLNQLKENIFGAHKETTVTGIKKIMRISYFLGKSEKNLNRYLTDSKKLSAGIKAEMKVQRELPDRKHEDFDKIVERIDIEAGHLIRDASRYEGELHKLLSHLDTLIHDKALEQAQQVIMQSLEVIEDAERWIAALSIDLKKAKDIAEEYSESYHENIDGIRAVIEPLNKVAKIDYLIHLLVKGKSLKKKTRKDVIELLKELIDHSYNNKGGVQELYIFAKKISQLGLFEEAAKIYEAEAHKHDEFYRPAGNNYQKFGDYRKAGEMFEKGGYSFSAAQCFERAKLFSKALPHYSLYIKYTFLNEDRHGLVHVITKNRSSVLYYLDTSFERGIYISEKLFLHEEKVKFLINQAKLNIFLITYNNRSEDYISYRNKTSVRSSQKMGFKSLKKAGFSKSEAWKQIGDWHDDGNHKSKAQAYENAKEWLLASKEWKKAGEDRKAERAIKRSTRLSKDAKNNLLIEQADHLFEQAQYVEAINKYQQAEAWDKVGDCYNKLGKGTLAIRMYKKAVSEFEKKFGLKEIEDFKPGKLEAFNLSDTLKAQQISKNLPNARSGLELTKVLNVIIPLIESEFDASTIIFYMKKSKIVQDNHWIKLADNFSTLGYHLHAAQCYNIAGDTKKTIAEYNELKRKRLAV
ncbi:hypothetical protein HQ489_05305 [Candidatus Woesearchaeota archaeon]|nr:hypothetical protein [Candidatus Woesearchaeota archaeon]